MGVANLGEQVREPIAFLRNVGLDSVLKCLNHEVVYEIRLQFHDFLLLRFRAVLAFTSCERELATAPRSGIGLLLIDKIVHAAVVAASSKSRRYIGRVWSACSIMRFAYFFAHALPENVRNTLVFSVSSVPAASITTPTGSA